MNTLKANKFKVGDKVQVIEDNGTEEWFTVEDQYIDGVVVQVNPKDKDDRYYVKIKGFEGIYDDGCFAFNDKHLKLIETCETVSEQDKTESKPYNPLKANKFRVGDYVEIINHKNTVDRFGGNTIGFPQIGLVGVVNKVTDHCVGIVDHMYLMDASDVELLETSDQRKEETQTYNPLIAQEGGGHYKNRGIQPLEYTMKNNLSFCDGNVVKYISRYKSKNGVEDLAKVIHYALLASYEEYGEQGSTELKGKVLKLLGVAE